MRPEQILSQPDGPIRAGLRRMGPLMTKPKGMKGSRHRRDTSAGAIGFNIENARCKILPALLTTGPHENKMRTSASPPATGNFVMSESAVPKSAMPESASLSDDVSRYEQACDQAIAMCDGNLRSTIKALIMANEYLEAELAELQAAVEGGCIAAGLPHARDDAA
jgi:hypothetical protein